MVRIRLRRQGAKGAPYYKIVVANISAMRDGAFVDDIGSYNPMKDPYEVKVNKDRALHWLKEGAQVSETVKRLLTKDGVWGDFESAKPPSKARRKAVKPRVKAPKVVKPKKVKPAPVVEEAPAQEKAEE